MSHTALEESGEKGHFVRTDSVFRHIISPSHPEFKPEFGRYHLYLSYACPWANRVLAGLHVKGLRQCIGVTIVHPTWQKTRPDKDAHYGWALTDEAVVPLCGHGLIFAEGSEKDPLSLKAKFVRDLYEHSHDTLGKYSVPVLWDKKKECIVNNESSEILRMLNSEFNEWCTGEFAAVDLYPLELREKIDEMNSFIYPNINNKSFNLYIYGVYKCGCAKSQEAYNESVKNLFIALDKLEEMLESSRYLIGNNLTEADIRLFVTLARFDEVYVVYFKCNKKRLIDYPNIRNYCRDVYQTYRIGETINMDHIKKHYYTSHPSLNSYAVVPAGPNAVEDFKLPHDRSKFI